MQPAEDKPTKIGLFFCAEIGASQKSASLSKYHEHVLLSVRDLQG